MREINWGEESVRKIKGEKGIEKLGKRATSNRSCDLHLVWLIFLRIPLAPLDWGLIDWLVDCLLRWVPIQWSVGYRIHRFRLRSWLNCSIPTSCCHVLADFFFFLKPMFLLIWVLGQWDRIIEMLVGWGSVWFSFSPQCCLSTLFSCLFRWNRRIDELLRFGD